MKDTLTTKQCVPGAVTVAQWPTHPAYSLEQSQTRGNSRCTTQEQYSPVGVHFKLKQKQDIACGASMITRREVGRVLLETVGNLGAQNFTFPGSHTRILPHV